MNYRVAVMRKNCDGVESFSYVYRNYDDAAAEQNAIHQLAKANCIELLYTKIVSVPEDGC